MPGKTIAVISDTHMPRRARALPPACLQRISAADLLIHAGDVSDGASLAYLETLGPPLVAVHGNVDTDEVRRRLPAERVVEVGPLALGVTHDAGPPDGRVSRLRRRFPACEAAIFGHTHIPMRRAGHDGFLILNPGSPTDKRRQPRFSMLTLRIGERGISDIAFHAVDEPAGPLPDELIAR